MLIFDATLSLSYLVNKLMKYKSGNVLSKCVILLFLFILGHIQRFDAKT